MSEKSIENQIKAWLKTLPKCHFWKIHGNAYQESGIPDIVGVLDGRMFAIEVKDKGKGRGSKIQKYHLRKVRDAGGLSGVAQSLSEAQEILEQ